MSAGLDRLDHRIRPLLLIVVLAALLSCDRDDSAFGPRDEDAFVSAVTGRVLDRRGKPLAGAIATALPGGGTAVTGSDGRFALGGLVPGSYAVVLSRDGYRDTAWSDSARPGLSGVVDLGALAMSGRFGVLAGLVLDSTGAPVPGAGVAVADQPVSVLADAQGRFRLAGVEVGAVRVVAASEGRGWGWIDTVLGSEDTLRELRPKLTRRGGAVVGRVAGADGKGASKAVVTAFGGALRAETDSSGGFEIQGIPDGLPSTLAIAAGSATIAVTGVRASANARTSVGTVQVPAASTGSATARNGVALVWTTDSVAILSAELASADTAFRLLRWLWSLDAGGTWDTTSGSSLRTRPAELGWTVGQRTVQVRALASDGRLSSTGRILVRVVLPPDWTPPEIRRAAPSRDTSYAWEDSAVAVSWIVSDDRLLQRVMVDSSDVLVEGDGSAGRVVVLPVGRSTVRVVAVDTSGNLSRDSLVLERAPRPDREPPRIAWNSPARDTAYAWRDSVAKVSWTVSDSVHLDSAWLDGDPVAASGFQIVFLPVGATTLRLRARDSAGNFAVDTLVLTRLERPDSTLPVVRRLSPSRDTAYAWRDSMATVSWKVFDDRRLDSVRIDGATVTVVDSVARRVLRLAPGAVATVRIRVRDASGNVVLDSLRLSRSAIPDTIPPALSRWRPLADTSVAWEDSLFRVAWSVSEPRLDSVWIQGVGTGFDTVAARTLALSMGTNVLRVRARDSAGNVSDDSLVVTRLERTLKADSVLGLLKTGSGRLEPAFHPDTLSYRDTVDIAATELLVQAVPLDASAAVTIGGVEARSRKVPLGGQGSVTSIAVVVRAFDGDSLVYTLRVVRPGDTTWGVAVLQGLAYGVLRDSRDGSEYRTVRIGGRNWMAENLAVVVDSSWCPTDRVDSCAKYGRLYAWSAAMAGSASSADASVGARGICPSGWHLPGDGEWDALVESVEGDARVGAGLGGTALKARRGWPDTAGGSDLFGFRALPSGYRFVGGDGPTGLYAHFWSATVYDSGSAFLRSIYHAYPRIYRGNGDRRSGYAVRCVEDLPDTSTALRSLAVSKGRLSPAFSPDRVVYDDTVGAMVDTLRVEAEALSAAARVTIEGGGLAILATDSVISVVVENAGRTRTYSVRVAHDPDTTHGIPWNAAASYGTLRDARDGKEYRTVEIGGRRWMAENLDHAVGGSRCYAGDPDSCDRNGRLYRWSAAMGLDSAYDATVWSGGDSTRQGVCPAGWRLPSNAEWGALVATLELDARVGSDRAGDALKSSAGWADGTGSDLVGFRALPAGWSSLGTDYNAGSLARFWSATGYSSQLAWSRALTSASVDVYLYTSDKSQSYSVRCIETIPDTTTMLRSLSVSKGALSPTFDPSRSIYVDTVGPTAESLSVVAIPASAKAVVAVDGGGTVDLSVDSSITVRVVNGANSRVYAVRVVHRPVDSTWGVPLNAAIPAGTLRDERDGKEYRTATIGDRRWMAENLAWKADSSWCPAASDDSCLKYGRLYSWTGAMGIPDAWSTATWGVSDSVPQGACPAGWHLPVQSDWDALRTHAEADARVGTGSAGRALKASGGWGATGAGTDLFGFRALPAGYTYGSGAYPPGSNAGFWTATPNQGATARVQYLYSTAWGVYQYSDPKRYGYSVRCVENPLDTSTALASLSVVGSGVLTPAFQSGILSYVDSVGASAESLQVSATAMSGKATVAIDGNGRIDLKTDSVIQVRVANAGATRVYEIRAYHRLPDTLFGVPLNAAVLHGVLRDVRDGKEYRTVRIGDQNWMAENLAWERDSSWCAIADVDSCGKYGRLYSWTAAMGFATPYEAVAWTDNDTLRRGACPAGWHLPGRSEWKGLVAELARRGVPPESIGVALRAGSGWDSPGSDRFGLRMLPSGYRTDGGNYAVGQVGTVWTATSKLQRGIAYVAEPTLQAVDKLGEMNLSYGSAVRCLEDPSDSSTALAGLGVDQGALSPGFLSTRLDYVDTLDPGVPSVTVTARAVAPGATVAVLGGATLDLSQDSVATVVVGNGTASRNYTLRFVHRAASDTAFGVPWTAGVSYGVLRDVRDNKSYRTVRIGGREWMAENLDHGVDSSYCIGGSSDSCRKYGRLYAWPAAMDVDYWSYWSTPWDGRVPRRGVCPEGWHLPSDGELRLLRDSVRAALGTPLGGERGALSSTAGWPSGQGGTDAFGFRLLPAGGGATAATNGQTAMLWTSTDTSYQAWAWEGRAALDTLAPQRWSKSSRASVRCVADLPDTSTVLEALAPSRGHLVPAFSPDVLSYRDTVESTDSVFSVAARAWSGSALVSIAGTTSLKTDSLVEVSVANGGRTRVYSVSVFHRAPRLDTAFGIPWTSGVAYGVLRDDRDGQSYRTVSMGGRRWMAENLNYRVDSSWCNLGSEDSCAKHGRLYSWSGAMALDGRYEQAHWLGDPRRHQGACPAGWHVPEDSEWGVLADTVAARAGIPVDSVLLAFENPAVWPNASGASDLYGFRLLPSGYRYVDGASPRFSQGIAGYWTATQYLTYGSASQFRLVAYGIGPIRSTTGSRSNAFSLRCVEDD